MDQSIDNLVDLILSATLWRRLFKAALIGLPRFLGCESVSRLLLLALLFYLDVWDVALS